MQTLHETAEWAERAFDGGMLGHRAQRAPTHWIDRRTQPLLEEVMLAQVGFARGGRLLEPPPYQPDAVHGCWRPMLRAKSVHDPLLPNGNELCDPIRKLQWPPLCRVLADPRVITAHVHAIMSTKSTLLHFTIDVVNRWGDRYLVEATFGAFAHATPITINSSRRDDNPASAPKLPTTYSFSVVPIDR